MRRAFLILFMIPAVTFAQKQPKPNLNKALNLWRAGKLDEAKEMIDLATTYEKTKDDGKTWYYRGIIYATLDTTSNEQYKSLADDAFKTAMESFAQADKMGKEGTDYSIPQSTENPLPITKTQQMGMLADYYLNKGIAAVQADEPNYETSVSNLEKTASIFENALPNYANDTLAYYVLGFAAQAIDQNDKAIEALNKYFKEGGSSKDAYFVLYQIYTGPKEDKEKALEVVRQGKAKHPNNGDFARLEIGLLIDLNRQKEAKEGLEAAVAKNPNDKTLHFYLAYTNGQLGNKDEAIKHYQEALRIDPGYWDAQYYVTQLYLQDVEALTKQINNLGISAADDKKKRELYQERVKKCENVIPYLEKLETMQAPDTESKIDVLEKLQLLYYYVADDAKEKVVKQKLKALGADVE